MANSLFQQLNRQSNPLVDIYKQLKMSNNPMQLLTNLCQSNPQINSMLTALNQSGKSPKDLFYEMAKQQNVDPNEILNMLK